MEYEKPSIADYGTLVELTEASAAGTRTDASFPAGTSVEDLTFSGPVLP